MLSSYVATLQTNQLDESNVRFISNARTSVCLFQSQHGIHIAHQPAGKREVAILASTQRQPGRLVSAKELKEFISTSSKVAMDR